MTRLSFDQLAGKTIRKAEIFLSHEGKLESDSMELTFTDGSTFLLGVVPSQPKFEYSTAASEEADMEAARVIERSQGN